MKKLVGGPGSACGMLLRIGQCASAAASIGVMVSAKGFSLHTAFCYLIASMGLQLLWSFGLACLDVYALRTKKDLRNPILVSLFVVGDWVTAMLSLAAACSSAGVVVLYAKDLNYCDSQNHVSCLRVTMSELGRLVRCMWLNAIEREWFFDLEPGEISYLVTLSQYPPIDSLLFVVRGWYMAPLFSPLVLNFLYPEWKMKLIDKRNLPAKICTTRDVVLTHSHSILYSSILSLVIYFYIGLK